MSRPEGIPWAIGSLASLSKHDALSEHHREILAKVLDAVQALAAAHDEVANDLQACSRDFEAVKENLRSYQLRSEELDEEVLALRQLVACWARKMVEP